MARREYQMPNVLRYKGPRSYWYIRYREKVLDENNQIQRKERWYMLGYCDTMTRPAALRRRDEIMRVVNREVYTIPSRIRFEDFVELYKRQHIPTVSAGTQGKYLSLLSNHLLPAFSGKRLCDVDTLTVQEFMNGKKEKGLAWWTRNDLKNLISSVFTSAEDWGYWNGRKPSRRISIGRKQWKRERRILSDDQFRRLLAALPIWLQLMVMTAVSTGMRVSEILSLKWRNVDLEQGSVSVTERFYRGDTDVTKSRDSERRLPLGELVEDYRRLKPQEADVDDYVFQEGGEPLDDREILKNYIRPAAERLGLYFPGFGWHSFRRQHITRIQEEGATAFEAQAQAGHSRPEMTADYTIINFERRKRAVLRLQKRLLGRSRRRK